MHLNSVTPSNNICINPICYRKQVGEEAEVYSRVILKLGSGLCPCLLQGAQLTGLFRLCPRLGPVRGCGGLAR